MNTTEEQTPMFEYNTGRRALKLPEYGRNVQKMVDYLKTIEDRDKRNEQARAVVKVMELLNPQVHLQDDWEHKLWDHLMIIADFELDVDSPYPMPEKETLNTRPEPVEIDKSPIRASYYGRNIESVINLVAGLEEGEVKDYALRNLASFMRMQYLTWNKDTVADETIFADIERLSEGRLRVPEGFQLDKVQPGDIQPRQNNGAQGGNRNRNRHNRQRNRKK